MMPNSQRSQLLTLKLVIVSCGFSATGTFLGFSSAEGQGRIGYAVFGSIALLIGLAASVYLIFMMKKAP
jgi:hypothetical protein